jgi:hypothetical protein
VTLGSGAIVDFAISGNVTSSQISNVVITSLQPETVIMSFTITEPKGTAGLGNITIPKSDISYGVSPEVYGNGQMISDQGYTQDTDNFYVWYTTSFDTNLVNAVSQVTVRFLLPSSTSTTSLRSVLLIGITVPEIVSIFTIIAVEHLRQKPEDI